MKRRRDALLIASALIAALQVRVAYGQIRQVDQTQLAEQMLSDSPEQRRVALAVVERMGLEKADRGLRAAMSTALIREANVHMQRYFAARRGEPLADLPDPEFIAELSLAVVELNDPATIPALSAALSAGPLVSLALANFGEAAAASVLQVVAAPDGWYDAVDAGLVSLRFMLEQRAQHPLSASTIAQIRAAATQRLNGKHRFTVLWGAMDLAATLGDADLRHVLELIASDTNEVFARGVENTDIIKLTQQRAADRLAGIPAKPRRLDVMTTQR